MGIDSIKVNFVMGEITLDQAVEKLEELGFDVEAAVFQALDWEYEMERWEQ
jgi:hypothetical protein